MKLFRLLPLLFLTLPANAQKSFLWEATSEAGTVYLLGSIHVVRPDLYPLSGAIEAAYAEADAVAFELDLDSVQAQAMTMFTRGMLMDGRTLRDVLTPETYALLEPRLEGFGEMGAMIQQTKPWMASLMLTMLTLQQGGYTGEGIDAHFFARAKADDKPRFALETLDQQIDLFDTMPAERQDSFLRYSLADLDKSIAYVDEMAAQWKAGDAEALAARSFDSLDPYPELRVPLLDVRNAAWVPQIEDLVAQGRTPLVVVGAMHLVGEQGLVELLRQRGYTVTQQ